MGDAIQRLRDLVALTKVFVPPHMSVSADGKPYKVDGYWRRGGSAAPTRAVPQAASREKPESVAKVHVEFVSGNSSKFWKARVVKSSGDGYDLETRWGKIGSQGQSKSYHFDYEWQALMFYHNRRSEKLGKGYKIVKEKKQGTAEQPTETPTVAPSTKDTLGTIVTILKPESQPATADSGGEVYVEYQGKKYWTASVAKQGDGSAIVSVEWGSIGGKAQKKDFSFDSPAEAQLYLDKKKKEKLAIGYNVPGEVTSPPPPKAMKANVVTKAAPALPAVPEGGLFKDAADARVESLKTSNEMSVKTAEKYASGGKVDYEYYAKDLAEKIGQIEKASSGDAPSTADEFDWLADLAGHSARLRLKALRRMDGESSASHRKAIDDFSSKQFQDELRIAIARLEAAKTFDAYPGSAALTKKWRTQQGRDRRRLEDILRGSILVSRLRAGDITPAELESEHGWMMDRLSHDKGNKIFGSSYGNYAWESMSGTEVGLAIWQAIHDSAGEAQRRTFLEQHGLSEDPATWEPAKLKKALRDVLLDNPVEPILSPLKQGVPVTYTESDNEIIDSLSAPAASAWLRAELNDSSVFIDAGNQPTHPLNTLYANTGGYYSTVYSKWKGSYATSDSSFGRANVINALRSRAVGAARYDAAYAKVMSEVSVPLKDGPDVDADALAKVKAAADEARARTSFRVGPKAKYVLNADFQFGGLSLKSGDVIEYEPDEGTPFIRWRKVGGGRLTDADMEQVAPFADPEGEDVPRYLSEDDEALWTAAAAAGSKVTEQGEITKLMKQAGANYVGKMNVDEKRQWVRLHNSGLGMLAFAVEVKAAGKGKPTEHKDLKTSPQSIQSEQGMIAAQLLADLRFTQSWGEASQSQVSFDKWTPEQQASFREQFGLAEGDQFATPEDVLDALNSMPLPPPNEDLMPVVVSKIEVARPGNVSEETWALVLKTEADPSFEPLKTFVPNEGFDPLPYADVMLEDGRVSSDVLPKNLLRLFGWSKSGEKSVSHGGPIPPADLSAAILYRANKGVYDPPPVPGAFGGLETNDGLMLLKSGDAVSMVKGDIAAKIVVHTGDQGVWKDYLGFQHAGTPWTLITPAGTFESTGPEPDPPHRDLFRRLLVSVTPENDSLDMRAGVLVRTPDGDRIVGLRVAKSTYGSNAYWYEVTPQGEETLTAWTSPNTVLGSMEDTRIVNWDGTETEFSGVMSSEFMSALRAQLPGMSKEFVPDADMVAQISSLQSYLASQSDSFSIAPFTPSQVQIPPRPVSRKMLDAMGVSTQMWDQLSDLEKNGLMGIKTGPWPGAPSDDRMLRDMVVSLVPRREAVNIPKPVLAFIALKQNDANFDKVTLDNFVAMVRAKAKQGGYGLRPVYVPPDAAYYKPLIQGRPLSSWDWKAKQEFANAYGIEFNYGEDNDSVFESKLDELYGVSDATSAPPPALGTIDQLEFTKAPTKNYGGMHSKSTYLDQFGREWMAKSFKSDPNVKARVEAEHYANLIGRLHGFRQPMTDARNLNGSYVYLQMIKDPSAPTLGATTLDSLTDTQLAEAAQEHVLDWLLSNHDTHDANLLIGVDGHVFGIDKGQAWKFFPKDKLAAGYLPPGNGAPVWYDRLYKAIRTKTISKERADRVVKSVLQKATRVASRHDAETRDFLEKAFANRKDFGGKSREEFIDAVMARKAALATDFETLYKGLYAEAGWEWSIPSIEDLGKARLEVERNGQTRAVYTSLAPEVMEATAEAGSHGVAIMLNSAQVDESHVILQREKVGTAEQLVGELYVRAAADPAVVAWIQKHTVTNDAQTTKALNMVAADLHNNAAWYATIVNAAKTVNVHQADGEYNDKYIVALKDAIVEMKVWKDGGLPSGMSEHDKKASLEMVDYYLAIATDVLAAKDAKTKTPSKTYQPYKYTPDTKKASIASEWKGGASKDAYLKKLSDGSYELTLGQQTGDLPDSVEAKFSTMTAGSKAVLTEAEGKALLDDSTMAWAEASVLDTTSLSGEQIKVFVRKNTRLQGTYDYETGTLNANDGAVVEMPGKEYDIEVGDLLIEYRPHSGLNVASSQTGMLRFRVKNFTGSDSSIQQAFDMIQSMGISMAPADEDSLELLYWQLATAQAGNRKVTPAMAGHLQALKAEIAPHLSANDPSTLLPIFRKHWTAMVGAEKVANADFMPHFDRLKAQTDFEVGKPVWVRPDMTEQEIREMALAGGLMPSHRITSGGSGPIPYTSLLATEERLRVLGSYIGGMSPQNDQGAGSAAYLFVKPQTVSQADIYVDPAAFGRMFTYAQQSDTFGNEKLRSQSPWSIKEMLGKRHEGMIKYHLSPYHLLAMRVTTNRDAIIKYFKDRGITDFDGIPVEDMFLSSHPTATKAKENLKKRIAYFEAKGVK